MCCWKWEWCDLKIDMNFLSCPREGEGAWFLAVRLCIGCWAAGTVVDGRLVGCLVVDAESIDRMRIFGNPEKHAGPD